MDTVIVKLNDKVELELKGRYYKARPGTRIDPPESAEFEIDYVMYNNEDVTPLFDVLSTKLTDDVWVMLEQLALNEIGGC